MAYDIDKTGPEYPPGPQPGSNGMGTFTIGISPVGTIPPFDVWKTVISQYANSPILIRLIENVFEYLDQTRNFDAFFDYIWNVDTAQGYGLDVWGRIVGVNRVLQVQTNDYLGFAESLPGIDSFNNAQPFTYLQSFGFQGGGWVGFDQSQFGLAKIFANTSLTGGTFFAGEPLTSNYALSDEAYRRLIFAKAAANITNGSIPAINRILMSLFPNRGNCFVTDGYQGTAFFGFEESENALTFGFGEFYNAEDVAHMVMTYTFEFQLTPVELAIVQNSGVLPKSTGVAASVVII